MVIRHIREHVVRHNWFAVTIDFAIVVLGVFVGLQAANWNQARIERAEAAEYRSQIIDNLRTNESDMAARMVYYSQVRSHAVSALKALQQPELDLGEQFLVDSYQASQVRLRPFERTAYDELIASGVARKVADAPIRAKLSAYYVGVRGFDSTALSVTDYRERLRRAMDLRVQEAMRRKCDEIVDGAPGGVQARVLPERCELGLSPDLVATAAAQLAALPELDQDLTRLIVDIDQKLTSFARISQNAALMRDQLEAAST